MAIEEDEMPYASVDAVTSWTAIGPFEWSLHALGACVALALAALKVEGVLEVDWDKVMLPLYVAVGLHLYFSALLFARLFIFYKTSGRKSIWLLVNCGTASAILSLLLFTEVALSRYLEAPTEDNLTLLESAGGSLLGLLTMCLPRLLVMPLPEDCDGDDEDDLINDLCS